MKAILPTRGLRLFRDGIIRWVRRYVNAHCINIVTYHSIAPVDGPFTQGVPQRHTPDELAAHMVFLRRNYKPTSLRAVVEAIEAGRRLDRAVVVTFDDGFRDGLTCAYPILRRFDVPMTIFPVTSVVGNHDLMWRHKLTWLIGRGLGGRVFDALRAEYRRNGVDPDGDLFAMASGATPDLYELTCRHFRPEIVFPLLDELLAACGVTGPQLARLHRPYLDPNEIAAADPRWIDFGNHTHTHPVLAALSPDEQCEELRQARDRLCHWVGRPPIAVAYPFGQRDSYNLASIAAVRDTAHRAALDLRRRINTGGVSPFELSRKPAPRNDTSAFECCIDDWREPSTRHFVATPAERMQLNRRMFRGHPRAVQLTAATVAPDSPIGQAIDIETGGAAISRVGGSA